jgi:hypothetical protein
MSEPTYGSGPSYGQGYGPAYEQQPYGQQQGTGPYGTGQQPQQPQQPQYGGGYGQHHAPGPGGYPSTGAPSTGGPSTGGPSTGAPTPTAAPRTPPDRGALLAQIVTYVGYVCAGAGLLGFILWLATDYGDGAGKFANALEVLVLGIGLGGLNVAAGTLLGQRHNRR